MSVDILQTSGNRNTTYIPAKITAHTITRSTNKDFTDSSYASEEDERLTFTDLAAVVAPQRRRFKRPSITPIKSFYSIAAIPSDDGVSDIEC